MPGKSRAERKMRKLYYDFGMEQAAAKAAGVPNQLTKAVKEVRKSIPKMSGMPQPVERKSLSTGPIAHPRAEAPVVSTPSASMHRAQAAIKEKARGNAVALSAALPVCCPPVRVPGRYRDVPTATATVYNVSDVEFLEGSNMFPVLSCQPLIPDGEMTLYASKDPLHAYGKVERVPYNSTLGRNLVARYMTMPYLDVGQIGNRTGATQGAAADAFVHIIPASTCNYEAIFACSTPANNCEWTPHGDAYFPFHEEGHSGFYINSATSGGAGLVSRLEIYKEGGAAIVETVSLFTLQQFNGTEWVAVGSKLATGYNTPAAVTIDIPSTSTAINGAIYRLTFNCDGASHAELRFSATFTWICDCLGFSVLPGLLDHTEHVESFRVSAASIMYSPVVPKLYEAGTLMGVQLPPNVPLDQFLSYDEISVLPGMFQKTLNRGIYGFHKPASDAELEFTHPFPGLDTANPRNTALKDPRRSASCSWFNTSGWIVVNARVPQDELPPKATFPAGKGYLTVNFGCEYTTTSQWPQQLYPSLEWDAYMDMLKAIKEIDQWHENHLHIEDIKRALLGAGKFTLKLAPTLLKLLQRYAPARYKPAIGVGREVADLLAGL